MAKRWLWQVGAGAVSGLVATGPMTAVMEAGFRRLPRGERYPLPPRQITTELAQEAGVADTLSEEEQARASLLSHFGYGAAMGALFGGLPRRTRVPAPLGGIIFGLLVWAGSYLGWLPALGVLPSATEEPRRRAWLMVAAHVVWGAVLGLVFHLLRPRRQGRPPVELRSLTGEQVPEAHA